MWGQPGVLEELWVLIHLAKQPSLLEKCIPATHTPQGTGLRPEGVGAYDDPAWFRALRKSIPEGAAESGRPPD